MLFIQGLVKFRIALFHYNVQCPQEVELELDCDKVVNCRFTV